MAKVMKKVLKKKVVSEADEEGEEDVHGEPEGHLGSGTVAVERATNGNGLMGRPMDDDLSWIGTDYADEDFKATVSRFKELVQDGSPEREIYRVAKNLMRIAKNLYKMGRLETARSYAWRSVEVLEKGSGA